MPKGIYDRRGRRHHGEAKVRAPRVVALRPSLAEQLVEARDTLGVYERCLEDMRERRAQYAFAIGALEPVVDDVRMRIGNLETRLAREQTETSTPSPEVPDEG